MRKRLFPALLTVALLLLASLPAGAQSRGFRVSTRSSGGHHARSSASGVSHHVFIPNFGVRPVLRERFPVTGFGFDAHHHRVIHGGRSFNGFFGGGFFGSNFFAGGFFAGTPFVGSATNVVVVPQAVPVQVPVPVAVVPVASVPVSGGVPIVVKPGLPDNWSRLRIARPSYPPTEQPLARLTLLALTDSTIFAVTDYWLEGDRLFYLTSTGRQDSLALRELDWETTNQLNAERGVDFVLRSR